MVGRTAGLVFKLDRRGLARVLGELEAQVMDIVWELGEATVQDVVDRLPGDCHYKTVQTVMFRLTEKAMLTRDQLPSRAHLYRPREDRATFLQRISHDVMEGLVRDFGELAIAQFVDVVDGIDPDRLNELVRLARERAEAAKEGAR